MARWLYTIVYTLVLPLIVLRLYIRALKAPDYRRRIGERFGCFRAPPLRQPIWVHAVSVGETIAAEPLIRRLQQQFPQRDIVVSTMTPTGSERVRALFGDSVFHVYAPYDTPWCVKAFLKKIRPTLLIIMETELWPNTLYYLRRSGAPAVLVNARLSAKSAIGYQNISGLSRPMLQNLSAIIAQTEADANRFQTLGVTAENIFVSGSIKFDVNISASLRESAHAMKRQWLQRLTWIAASTHAGEDEVIVAAHSQLLKKFPGLLLLLVPRHPERFDVVARMVEQQGLSSCRRSSGEVANADTQVIIGDTMGELLLLYGVADVAFVGGSMINRGGHNMLEPAAWGCPVVTGPSDFNFAAISDKLEKAGALVKVDSESALVRQVDAWLESDSVRQQAGRAAISVVEKNRGVLTTVVERLGRWL